VSIDNSEAIQKVEVCNLAKHLYVWFSLYMLHAVGI